MGDSRRPDLRRWLEMMINEGRCQGLIWENEAQKRFRLPWPHQKSREWKEADCQILIEWAKHTGKYKPGDPLDFPTWKTRIRTALNKNREIREIPPLHKLEGSNPYKVYQLLPTSPSRTRGESSPPHTETATSPSTAPLVNQFYEQLSPAMSNQPNVQQMEAANVQILSGQYQISHEETIKSQIFLAGSSFTMMTAPNIPNIVSETKVTSPLIVICKPQPTSGVLNRQPSTEEMDTSDSHQISNLLQANSLLQTQMQLQNMRVAGQPATELPYQLSNDDQIYHSSIGDDTSMPSDLKSIDSLDLCRLPADIPQMQPNCYLHVQVLYGPPFQVVNSSRVKTQRCRLFFGSPNRMCSQEASDSLRDEIQMPDFKDLPHFSDKQKEKINEALFENEGGEVILTYSEDGDVYAERRCLTRVFCSDGVSESEVVPRTKKNRPVVPSKVFDYTKKFSSELTLHKEDPKNPLPRDHFYLTFGHEILKNDDYPLRVVPVYVVVRHVQAACERKQFTQPTIGSPLISADSSSFDKKISIEKKGIEV